MFYDNILNLNVLPKNFRMGFRHYKPIYLRRPSWDCGWYWGFGYLGNANCHFHLDCLEVMDDSLRTKNLFDQLHAMFGDSLTITNSRDLWQFCDIVQTIYTLKKAAEVFGRGGSNYTKNPDAEALKDSEIVKKINEELIPHQIVSLYKILEKYSKYALDY